MVTQKQIIDVYDVLIEAKRQYAAAQEQYLDEKFLLDTSVAQDVISGAISGKNDRERDAAARERYQAQFDLVARLERISGQAKLALDIAQLEEEKLSKLLRLYELVGWQVEPAKEEAVLVGNTEKAQMEHKLKMRGG